MEITIIKVDRVNMVTTNIGGKTTFQIGIFHEGGHILANLQMKEDSHINLNTGLKPHDPTG